MALNPLVLQDLEACGLTNDHLQQLLAVCSRGAGRATWHIDREGHFAKIEVTLFASVRDTSGMRDLTQLLRRERS